MTDPLTRVPGIWRAGMLVTVKGRRIPFRIGVLRTLMGLPQVYLCHREHGICYWEPVEVLTGVDIDDPTGATTGCLASVCRGLYGLPRMFTVPVGDSDQWVVLDGTSIVAQGPTEAAAWRNAILAHHSISELR